MATRLVTATFVVEAGTEEDADKVAEMMCDDLIDQPDLWISAIMDYQSSEDAAEKADAPVGDVKIMLRELK